jgi:D-alanine-D-alanine ligase-like ATP-grasp enzyme
MELSIFLRPIIEEAESRNIHCYVFSDVSKNYAVLRYNDHEEFINNTLIDNIGAATNSMLKNKYLQSVLLSQKGYSTPKTQTVYLEKSKRDEFIQQFNQFPCVVKPLDNYGGKGITVNITNHSDLEQAIELACGMSNRSRYKDRCIVQEMLQGEEYRILVIGNKDVFLVKRTPFQVIGDGKHSIQELIQIYNENTINSIRKVKIGSSIKHILQEKSLALDYIPQDKEIIKLSYKANSHDGGSSQELTDFLPEGLKQFAIKLSLDFKLPVVGIDIITSNLVNLNPYILELNINPGLTIHNNPTFGVPTKPQKAIIDLLFPETKNFK